MINFDGKIKLNSNIDRSSLEKNRINLKQFKKLVIIIEYFWLKL